MSPELEHLRAADPRHALEIAPRIWWVGHVLPDDPFQCHVYLLEQGEQSVLFDPGSRLTFAGTLRKIEQVMSLAWIRYFVCHHQDPDIAAALPLIDELIDRPDACVVTHWRTRALLRHYGLRRLGFWLVDENDWRLPLEDRALEFVFTPYAHFPGAICSFDATSGVLFSSDLFGGFSERPTLVARDERYFDTSLRPFHEHYMPSNDILGYALEQIARHPVAVIAPQHGSLVPRSLVPFMIDQLKRLECGLYLLGGHDTDFRRLSQLNATLRDIAATMLLYRDFRDIATRLLELVRRGLPAERIDYYIALSTGAVLALTRENRYAIEIPNGASLNLEAMPGVDMSGYAGVRDKVNNHWGKLITSVVLSSTLSAAVAVAEGDSFSSFERDAGQAASQGAAQAINQAGGQIVQRSLQIQPTLEIRPGQRVAVMVNKDLALAPYVE